MKKKGVDIKYVATDLSAAFISSVYENCPNAVHVFDHFHVVKLMNEKLDDIRRVQYNMEKDINKRKVLKGTRFLLLCNGTDIFDKKYTNMPLLAKYMLHGSHILEEECQMCPFLPICSNDCAHNRVSNKFNGTEYELCSIYKGNDFSALSALLYDYYLKFVESQPVQQQ